MTRKNVVSATKLGSLIKVKYLKWELGNTVQYAELNSQKVSKQQSNEVILKRVYCKKLRMILEREPINKIFTQTKRLFYFIFYFI
jgi:hypothetical protein